MVSNLLTLLSLAAAIHATPIEPRQEPKASRGKGGLFGKSSGSGAAKDGGGGGALGGAFTSLGGMSSNDITKPRSGKFECKKAALLFARGTGEPGTMGYVVGPGLSAQLKKALNGDVLLEGISYTTNFSGGGAKEMAKVAKELIAKCPNTKIILGGYSQGAMQVHQALGALGSDAGKISVAVTFGDPYSNMGWGSGGIVGAVMGLGGGKSAGKGSSGGGGGSFNPQNGMIICGKADFVCGVTPNLGAPAPKGGSAGGSGSHLSYSTDGSIGKAVEFIVGKLNSGADGGYAPSPAASGAGKGKGSSKGSKPKSSMAPPATSTEEYDEAPPEAAPKSKGRPKRGGSKGGKAGGRAKGMWIEDFI